jgi:hypothetical protein
MRITMVDPRNLAVAVVTAGNDKFYNWTTYAFEQPFNAAAHLKPLAPMETSALFSQVLTADLGTILLQRTDASLVILTVDSSGNPLAVVDCWTLPNPRPDPGLGGWVSS